MASTHFSIVLLGPDSFLSCILVISSRKCGYFGVAHADSSPVSAAPRCWHGHSECRSRRTRRLAAAPSVVELRLPRRWWSRVFLPVLLIAGFGALALWASWDLVSPPVAVKVVPVRVQTGTVEVVGQELFRANGWVEPLPRPIDVPVQTEGMYRVKEVLVNPGDRVTRGKPLVLLDDARAELDLEAAGEAARQAARRGQGRARGREEGRGRGRPTPRQS